MQKTTYTSNETTSIVRSLCSLLSSILARFQVCNLETSCSCALDLRRGRLAKGLI
jgi:hypothetical protein